MSSSLTFAMDSSFHPLYGSFEEADAPICFQIQPTQQRVRTPVRIDYFVQNQLVPLQEHDGNEFHCLEYCPVVGPILYPSRGDQRLASHYNTYIYQDIEQKRCENATLLCITGICCIFVGSAVR